MVQFNTFKNKKQKRLEKFPGDKKGSNEGKLTVDKKALTL